MEIPFIQWFLVTIYLMGALSTLPLLYRTVPRHSSQGGTAMILLISGLGLWTFTDAMQLAAPLLSVKMYFAKLNGIPYAIVPIAWAIFVAEYTNYELRNKLAVYTSLIIVGVSHNLLVSTNELHNLYWSTSPTLVQDPFPLLSISFGPAFYVFTTFYVVLSLIAVHRLFRYALNRGITYEEHARLLGIGTSAILVAELVTFTPLAPYDGLLDTSALGVVTAQAVLLFAIYRLDLIELAPGERDQLLYDEEGLQEANDLINRSDIDLPTVSIGEIATATATSFYEDHDYTEEDLHINVDCQLELQASEDLLKRFFNTLYENSIEHNPAPVEVYVSELMFDEGFVVEDDGKGIPDDFKQHAFDPRTTSKSTSSGNGLAVINRIATAHNWDIELLDSVEGGVRFEITNVGTPP